MKKEQKATPISDMTLEDFLAALAMIGLMNSKNTIEARVEKAYAVAHAMVRRREHYEGK